MDIKRLIEDSLWKDARSKKYRATPEEIERTEREKRIQREIDEKVRKQAFKTPEDTEQPPAPKEPA